MNVLLAEDDERLGRLVTHMLEQEGYHVEWAKNGEEVFDYFSELSAFQVLILDWMMPYKSGIEVCKEARKIGFQGAILMLTAKDSIEDRVIGLDTGADDYLIKPFDFQELFARVRALQRRSYQLITESDIQTECFILDCQNQVVILKSYGRSIQLTPKEFQVLKILAKNQGNLVTREVIMNTVWGLNSVITDNTLDATIKMLRKKIACKNHEKIIHTVRGMGFKLEE